VEEEAVEVVAPGWCTKKEITCTCLTESKAAKRM
jgi:hypothetical protein